MKALRNAAFVVFVLAVPLLVFASSVRFVVNDLQLYHNGFVKYSIPSVTGISLNELDRATKELVQYFDSNEDYVHIVLSNGMPLYNEKEIVHLKDVKDLIQFDYRLQWIALAYVLVYAALNLVWGRRQLRQAIGGLGRAMMYGGWLTLGLMAAIAVSMLVAFDQVFILFHEIGFRNLLWILDPATDKLIQMFPEGFFNDVSLVLAGVTIAGALIVGGAGWWLRRYFKRQPVPG